MDEAPTFAGKLSRGSSAAADDVQVALADHGLVITLPDGRRETWAYEALISDGPLLPGEEAVIGHRAQPGRRLFVPDAAFTRALLARAPQLSARRHRRRVLWPMLAATAVLLALGAWLWFSSFSLARVIAGMLPQGLYDSVGQMVARSMAPRGFCENPDGVAALNTLLLRLSGSREEMRKWKVKVAKMDVINAFTAPGGHIIISHKLIRFARSPDEVAAVLAHEMGHAAHMHPEAGLVRAAGISLIAAVMFGDSNIGGLAALLTQLKFTRDAERESDRFAVQRMRAAGLDAAALADFLQRLGKSNELMEEDALIELFQTHPITTERVRAIRALAGPRPPRPVLDAVQWRALRAICD